MIEKYDADWFKSAFNSMDDLILIKGDNSKLLWANTAFLKYYGMSEQELFDIIDSEHSDPDDTLQYVKDDTYVFTQNKTLNIPAEAVTDSSGVVRYFHTIKSPIRSADGHVKRSVGVSRIIEDSSLIEKSDKMRDLRKETIQFQKNFIKQVKIPSLFIDAQNRVVMVSNSFSEIFKLDAEAFLDKNFSEIFPNLDIKDKKIGYSNYTLSINNHEINGDVTISPWYLSGTEEGGYLIFFRDKTEEVNLLSKLEEEKKRSLMNDRLKSLSVLSAGVAHEVNNPLAIILGTIEKINLIYNLDDMDSRLKEDLEIIERNSLRISGIVKGLKSLSRDSTHDDRKTALMSNILKDAFSMCGGRIKNLGIKAKTNITNDFNLNCRAGEIVQVILNLLNNSIDEIGTQKGSWIEIQLLTSKSVNIVNVVDSGIGVNEEVMDKIFDPFYTTKEVGEGTGLGLGICADIIKSHGGELFYNRSAEHTTFTIEFPKE